ncbi:uncharacterized protein LOC136086063 [Hydra vulgaris]|uniref:uncharacterized protein LOC136086063 n=1 Tax=Hydra vulgaris TaxID=6087 RepID=UPI0032EA2929
MHIRKNNPKHDYFIPDMNNHNIITLKKSMYEKDLGINFSANLKWKQHAISSASKANKEMFKVLYTTLVHPHLEYSIAVWSPYLKGNISVLEPVQRLRHTDTSLGTALDFTKSASRQNYILNQAATAWNELPDKVVDSYTLTEFKNNLDKYQQKNYNLSCGNKCSDWKRNEDYIVEKNGTCNIQENRTCFNIFLNQQYTESRLLETQCTEPNCTTWIAKNAEIYKLQIDSCLVWQIRICSQGSSKYTEERIATVQCQNNICLPWNPEIKIIYFTNENCAIQQTRACINPLTKISTTQIQNMNISCHYVSNNRSVITALKAEKFTSKENSQNLYTFGGVGAFLLIAGFLIGTVSFRYYHKKKCLNHIKITLKGKKSFSNNAFVTDIQATLNNPHDVCTYNMFNSLQKDTEPILNFKKPNFYVKHVRSHSAVVIGSAKLNGVFPSVYCNNLSYKISSKHIEVSNNKITSNQNLNKKASRLHNLEKEINISEKFDTKKFTPDQSFSILI